MKKIMLSLVVVLVLVMSFCAVNAEDFKIGIMTEVASTMEETYRIGEELAAQYPEMVIHVTYPENSANEIETTISTAMSLAYDEDVKAIVFCSGVVGTAAAIDAVKELRPDMLTIVCVPVEDIDVTCASADIAFRQNVTAMGAQIADAAKEMGCDAVVHYSFARHMSSAAIEARANAMKEEAEKIGIEYLYVDTPDPLADTGKAYSYQYVLEQTRELSDKYANKVAFFTSQVGQIESCVTGSMEKGSYYTMPSDPGPFNGVPSALGIEVPDEHNGDFAWMLHELSAKLAEMDRSGHMFNWPVSVLTVCEKAAFEYALMYCNGETNGTNDADALLAAFNKVTPVEQLYVGPDYASDAVVDNFYTFVADYVIL